MAKSSNLLNLEEFRSVYRAGGFKSIVLMGEETRFVIYGLTANKDRMILVSTRRHSWRFFGSPVMAFKLLQDMGVMEFQVALQGWSPREEALYKRRKDVAYRMRKVHQLGQKQLAEEEANAPPQKTAAELYEEVDRELAARRFTVGGPRAFLDSEGRMDAKRTNAWLQAEREGKVRATEGGWDSRE